MKKVKVKEVVEYYGHSISPNGSVNFSLKADYSELTNTIMLMQMLNNDIIIKCKIPTNKPFKIGVFRLKKIEIDGDGESKIKFNGLTDFIEMDNLNILPASQSEEKRFTVMMETEIEDESEE